MPETKSTTAPSTQEVPVEQKQIPVPPKSIHEQVELALKERESKGKENEPKPELIKEEKSGDETKLPEPTETGSTDDAVDKVTLDGKDVPLAEIIAKAKFEIPALGEMREVDGDKLIELASLGYTASMKNAQAKEAVLKAQEIIQEVEKSSQQKVQDGVAAYLNDLYDKVINNINPQTGEPFESVAEKAGAVEIAGKLVKAHQQNGKGKTDQPTLTQADVEKLLEEKISQRENAREESTKAEKLAMSARETMEKVATPYKQFFLKSDGKTLNARLYNDFLANVMEESKVLWQNSGSPRDSAKIGEFITKASQSVIQDYKEGKTQEVTKEAPKVQAIRPSSGAPVSNNEKVSLKGLNFHEAAEKMKAIKGTR